MTFQDLCQSCGNDLPRVEQCCRLCARELSSGEVCGRCLQHPPLWQEAHVALRYEMPVDHLLHQFKYAGDRCAGRLCGQLLNAALPSGVDGVVVPVPMHGKRYIERGFNHSEVLARDISRARGLPFARLATRVRETVSQVGLDARARRRNVRNAFVVSPAVSAAPLILVDDIFTTGETLRALVQACIRAGYRDVRILCVARAARDDRDTV